MFSELFANNLLVKLLRGDTGRYDLMTSMVGAKLGERLLVVGGGDGQLVAALGAKTGLTGTVAAAEPDEATADRVLEEATKAGVLADVDTAPPHALPSAAGSFDIVVLPFPTDETATLAGALAEAFRVLRDGGRVAVIARAAKGERRDPAPADGADARLPVVTALHAHGFRAARLLAERNGLVFYEGVKK